MSAQYVAELTRPQKAAALMMAVGPQQASDLLAFLSETEVEALAKEIAALRDARPRLQPRWWSMHATAAPMRR